jgi:chromosomal replication initiator protein
MTFDVPITQGRIFREPTRRMRATYQTEQIRRMVANAFGLTDDSMMSRARPDHIAVPRMLAMALCREFTSLSLCEIAAAFRKKDHATVLHAVKAIRNRAETCPKFAQTVQQLRERLR